jgi:paraquat-inducible protein B
VNAEKAATSTGSSVSAIWFIPLLALLLGAYMVVHGWMTEGPEIEIAFSTAEGLEAGKTKIKYRSVDMGVVEKVRLSDDFKGVIATAKLERQALELLREDTEFWVVTARVGVGQVTGLSTLLSGAYIQIDPGQGEPGRREFVALETPPLTPTDADGLRLSLNSDTASSVSTGDAVLYNGYKVGRVESEQFKADGSQVNYTVFIDAPYHNLVNSSSRFWDVSGVSLSAGADGFKVETGSLDTILLGGVAFGLPDGVRTGQPVKHNAEFKLYGSYEDILANPFRYGTYYVVSFSQSIKGLQPGAPVEFRGIQVGRVERILMKESLEEALDKGLEGRGDPIPILIYVEPARMELPDSEASVDIMRNSIETGVGNGMRASLESGNLLTGAKYIGIDYFPNAEPAELGSFQEWSTIPTIGTGLGQLQQQLSSILNMFNELPLQDTVESVNSAVSSLDETLGSLNTLLEQQGTQQLPAELNATLEDLRGILQGFSPDSEAYRSLNSSLLRLNRTLSNLESITGTLASQPNAVILPSDAPPDPIPEKTR